MPQLFLSPMRSTQWSPHSEAAVSGQRQKPWKQVRPPVQTVAQSPQWPLSAVRSAQNPLQLVSPVGQVQTPVRQLMRGSGQACPQAPQLLGSVARLTHRLLHIVRGGMQMHRGGSAPWNPVQQTALGGQVIPHRPQLCGSRARSTQVPSQSVRGRLPSRGSPGGQTQIPAWQVFPPVQMLPQRPQFWGSMRCCTQRPLQQIVPGGHALPHTPQWFRS